MIKISLVKPILNTINSFDATQDYLITFLSNGDQFYANEINIYRNDNNSLVYNNKTGTSYFQLNHTIPANTLSNTSNYSYKIQIRTFNVNGDVSIWSDWLLFSCYSNPTIDINNVTNNGIIENQTYNFQSTYSQAQNDLLQSYQYTLYNSNMIEIADSGLLFDGKLSYQFTGLNNNQTYSVRLIVTSQHGMSVSIKKTFTAIYVQPTFSNLVTLTNNSSQASIDVQIEAIRILGKIGSGNPTIENGDWLNVLNGGTVYFDNNNGFMLPVGDWSLQLWVKNLIDTKTNVNGVLEGTLITKLYGQNNVTFKIEYYDGRFHLYKFIGDFLFSHYASNVINATVDNVVYLFCQSIDNRIELKSEIIN